MSSQDRHGTTAVLTMMVIMKKEDSSIQKPFRVYSLYYEIEKRQTRSENERTYDIFKL